MNIDTDKLVKELEDMYENSCFKKATEAGNEKCLALDEQELAIMHMCIEGLAIQEGIDKNNYISRGLFILLKNRDLGGSVCVDNRIKEEPLKYKKFEEPDEYLLDNMTNLLLVYYAALLFYANDKNTGDYNKKSKRCYFKVYAYFACICPKTFNILFFNQLHLFMSKAHKNLSPDELKIYLDYTDELWVEYNSLLQSERRIEISEEVITQFSEIMAHNEEIFFENRIKIENFREDGFLAFDFKGGDTLREYRFKTVLVGIDYFQWYLKYLKLEISENSFREESLLNKIDKILANTVKLKSIFENLLENENVESVPFKREFDNIYGLLEKFYEYCNNKVILIDK